MALDLWTHQFCLACDKQTDGAAYCSESCRLAEFESSSAPSSGASSPCFNTSSTYSWTTPRQQTTKFQLSPAYDFRNPQPYGSTPQPNSYLAHRSEPTSVSKRVLSPSSSHSSLCSMQSTSSAGAADSTQLSDKAKRELRAYAVSFEQVRMQRRRSY